MAARSRPHSLRVTSMRKLTLSWLGGSLLLWAALARSDEPIISHLPLGPPFDPSLGRVQAPVPGPGQPVPPRPAPAVPRPAAPRPTPALAPARVPTPPPPAPAPPFGTPTEIAGA